MWIKSSIEFAETKFVKKCWFSSEHVEIPRMNRNIFIRISIILLIHYQKDVLNDYDF